MIPEWLRQDPIAVRFTQRLGMTWEQAADASFRVAHLVVDAGMPEAHAVTLCEAMWWERGKR